MIVHEIHFIKENNKKKYIAPIASSSSKAVNLMAFAAKLFIALENNES